MLAVYTRCGVVQMCVLIICFDIRRVGAAVIMATAWPFVVRRRWTCRLLARFITSITMWMAR